MASQVRVLPPPPCFAFSFAWRSHAEPNSEGDVAFAVRDMALMGRTAHQGLFASPSAADRAVVDAKLPELGVIDLADKPYTMVLDEPTANLDFGNEGKVMRRIRALTEQGLGVLFTTHDPNRRCATPTGWLCSAMVASGASGCPRDILTTASLQHLYGAPVERVGSDGKVAFLPS